MGVAALALAVVAAVQVWLIGLRGGSGPSRTLGGVEFFALAVVVALILAWVIGTIVGLAVGLLIGLSLWLFARTAAFRSATPQRQRHLAAAIAVAGTAVAGLIAQSAWFGPGLDWPQSLVVYVPAAAGAVVAARLSRTLPPAAPLKSRNPPQPAASP